jgi:tape measure domain-containing protein
VADLDQAITISIIGQDGLSLPASAAAASLQKLQQAASESTGVFGRLFDSVNQGIGVAAGFAIFDHIGDALRGAASAAIGFNQTLDGARATMSRYFDSAQSVNNSIANLNDLAAKTPFAFEGLLTAQQRTIAAARSADELRLNMDAIAVASANTGRVSTENMDRISLALGQMQSKGHLAGGEMLQLTEAGVNMGEILSKHFGVSTAAIQKMVTEGKIGAQDVFQALRENAADPRNREALDKLAKTWEGALSTIGDVGRTVIAGTFRPFFDLMTEGAVAVADFLQTDQFRTWAEAVRLGFESVSAGVKSFLDSMAPIGQAISTAFGQATQGDFGAAFTTISAGFTEQLAQIGASISEFAHGMFGAGADLIGEFANGMLQGGVQAVQEAINAVASVIASFLIGNSPPPAGPLARIDEGGTNTAAAWTDAFGAQMAKGTGAAVAQTAGTISQLKDAAIAIAGQIRDITDQTQALDRVMRGLKGTIDDVKAGFSAQKAVVSDMAEAAKDSYATAIQGVRDQIDTIKDSHQHAVDAVQKQIDGIKDYYSVRIDSIKDAIGSIKDTYAALEEPIQAQIDAIKDKYTAAIETVRTKIDSIKESYAGQESAIQRVIDTTKEKWSSALDDVHNQITKITDAEAKQLDPLEKQLQLMERANTYLRERQDAERSIANAKSQQLMLDSLGDPVLRAQLSGQLAGVAQQQQQIDLAQQLAETRAKLAGGGLSGYESQSLSLKISQLTIQKQLADMVNTTTLAEATRQASLLDSQQKQLAATREIEDANRKITEIPIEEKIARIKDTASDALAPLQAHLKSIEHDQKAALDPLEEKLKRLKGQEADALLPLTTQLKGLEHDQKAALDPLQDKLRDLKREEQGLLLPLTSRLHDLEYDQREALKPLETSLKNIKEDEKELLAPLVDRLQGLTKEADLWSRTFADATKDIDRRQREALGPLQAQLEIYQHQKDVLADQRQDLEAIKQRISEAIAAQQQAAKAGGGISATGAPVGGIHFDLTAAQTEAENKVKEWGATLATKISEGFKEHGSEILQTGIGAVLGGLAFGPLGAIVGGALAPSIWASVNERLKAAGFDASPVLAQIVAGVKADNWAVVGEALWSGLQGAWAAGWRLFTRLDDAITLWLNAQIEHIEWDRLGAAFGKAIGDWLTGSTKDGADQAGDDIVRLDTGSLSRGISTFFSAALDAAWEAILQHWRGQEPGSSYGKVFIDGLDAAGWVGALHAVDVKLLEEWNAHRQADYDNLVAWNKQKTDELVRAYADWHVRQQGVIDDLVAQWNDHRTTDAERWNAWTANIGQRLSEAWGTISTAAGNAWGSVRDAIGAKLTEIGALFAQAIPTWIQAGIDLIQGIQTGISNALSGFWDWIKTNLIDQIPQFIRDTLNLDHDTGAMALVGERMVQELEIGMQNRWPKLEALIGGLAGRLGQNLGGISTGGDVDDWLKAAIAITGVGEDWLSPLRRLVSLESSGNPNAVNETDVYGVPGGSGPHAKGLIQVIDPTFQSERDRSLPDDIFNPVANAVASIHHIIHAWGTPWDIPGVMDGDTFKGYATGGIAWNKQLAWVGENEPEAIVPFSQIRPPASAIGGQGGGIDYDQLAAVVARATGGRPIVNNFHGMTQDEAFREADRRQRRADRMASPRP